MTYQEEGQVRQRRLLTKQAIALAMQGRWREAVVANQAILESFPADVESNNRLGRAYMELGVYSSAREAYGKTLEFDPYNTIAERNLRRLSHLREAVVNSEEDTEKVDPRQFIEETGKAGVVALHRLAPPETLARMVAGDRVYLKIEGASLAAENGRGEYLGLVEARHGQRLAKLTEGGNEYTASIVSSTEERVTVIIREAYQHPTQMGLLSFPTKGLESIRSYASDRMIRRELEYEYEMGDESGYTIISGDGEVLLEELSEAEDKDEDADEE